MRLLLCSEGRRKISSPVCRSLSLSYLTGLVYIAHFVPVHPCWPCPVFVVAQQVQLLRKLLRTDCDGARKSMLEGKLVLPTNQAPSLPVIGGGGDGQMPMWGMPEVGQAGGLEHRIHAEA